MRRVDDALKRPSGTPNYRVGSSLFLAAEGVLASPNLVGANTECILQGRIMLRADDTSFSSLATR